MHSSLFVHVSTPARSKALKASATVLRAHPARSAIFLQRREAKAAPAVVEAVEQGAEDRERLGADEAIGFAGLRAPRQGAGSGHHPELGFPVERAQAAVAE
jgi:hypothetical protein